MMEQREDTSRNRKRLTPVAVRTLTEGGLYHDGDGLYLQITASGGKSWVLRYQRNGKAHSLGLGPLRLVGLAEARAKALRLKKDLLDGVDPLAARKAKAGRTFGEVADIYIREHASGWRSPTHARQWRNTLQSYVLPKIGSKPVAEIDVEDVLTCIRPLWSEKTETASRIRNRIELVLAYAMAHGWRPTGPNPAAWRGHIEKLLPPRAKVAAKQHYAALAYSEVPTLMARLAEMDSPAARALQATILSGARTNEALGMEWTEIDFEASLWTLPANRTKPGRQEHRIPLAPAAVAILRRQQETSPGKYVFGGEKPGQHLSVDAMQKLLKRMAVPGTVHGFRSSLRQWIAECTDASHEIAELALGHTVHDATVRAYQRSDLLARRRKLADDWANFVTGRETSLNVGEAA